MKKFLLLRRWLYTISLNIKLDFTSEFLRTFSVFLNNFIKTASFFKILKDMSSQTLILYIYHVWKNSFYCDVDCTRFRWDWHETFYDYLRFSNFKISRCLRIVRALRVNRQTLKPWKIKPDFPQISKVTVKTSIIDL
jgi:hypothetical protein